MLSRKYHLNYQWIQKKIDDLLKLSQEIDRLQSLMQIINTRHAILGKMVEDKAKVIKETTSELYNSAHDASKSESIVTDWIWQFVIGVFVFMLSIICGFFCVICYN